MPVVSDILLADAARAFARLSPEDDDTAQAIARLLGFDLPQVHALHTAAIPPRYSVPAYDRRHGTPDRTDSELGDALPPSPPLPDEAPSPLTIPPVTSPQSRAASWLHAQPLDPFLPEVHLQGVPLYEPLFRRPWTPGIISLALATGVPDGPIDVARLVETFASGKPVKAIPRLPRPSLFRGVQVLVDVGEGMQPFLRDAEELQRQLARVINRNVLQISQFRGCPALKAGTGPEWEWKPVRPPAPGTPMLIVSDLGIAPAPHRQSPFEQDEWLGFVHMLANRGCPAVAFVPFPPARWPPQLRQRMTMIQWDRPTSASTVRRAIGRILEIRR